MSKKLALVALVLFVLALVASPLAIVPARAGGLFNDCGVNGLSSAVGVSMPIYTAQTSEETQTGQVQIVADYNNCPIWSWDAAETSYLGVLPAGIGMNVKVYPNPLSELPILTMAATESELVKNLKINHDKVAKCWSLSGPGVQNLIRDTSGRFYLNVPLTGTVGTDVHCLRFYALIKDAKRKDHTFLILIHWASKSNKTAMIDTLRFKTEAWPTTIPPTPDKLVELLRRAGNGGNGQVFASLLGVSQQAAQTTNATAVPVSGNAVGCVQFQLDLANPPTPYFRISTSKDGKSFALLRDDSGHEITKTWVLGDRIMISDRPGSRFFCKIEFYNSSGRLVSRVSKVEIPVPTINGQVVTATISD
jgi:hypothetical protein